jgi:hypothetical protein
MKATTVAVPYDVYCRASDNWRAFTNYLGPMDGRWPNPDFHISHFLSTDQRTYKWDSNTGGDVAVPKQSVEKLRLLACSHAETLIKAYFLRHDLALPVKANTGPDSAVV